MFRKNFFLISGLRNSLSCIISKSPLDFYNFSLYYRNRSSRTFVLSMTEQLFLVK
nr:MAG TPA: hypothetical protein [Caudoviricetes sp.]